MKQSRKERNAAQRQRQQALRGQAKWERKPSRDDIARALPTGRSPDWPRKSRWKPYSGSRMTLSPGSLNKGSIKAKPTRSLTI